VVEIVLIGIGAYLIVGYVIAPLFKEFK